MKAHIIAAMLLAAAPAVAHSLPPRAEQGSDQNLSSFVLRNESDQTISQATATSTAGTRFDLTRNSAIAPQQAQEFMMKVGECLASVQIRFKDGHQVQASGLNDCKQPEILTDGSRVTLRSEAGGPLIKTD
jgi:hypothetical protein